MTRLLRSFAATLAVALAAALSVAGCDHVTDFDGPRLVDRFGPFALLEPLQASRVTADFAAGETVVFTARFNKQTNWVLEIIGLESGAVRRIEGFSSELNASNARWEGRTTVLPFFGVEPVRATLSFPDEAEAGTSATSLNVLSPRTYPGSVVADFEGGDNIRVGNFEFELAAARIEGTPRPAQGSGYFLLRGTDNVVRNFFVGLIDILPRTAGTYFAVPTSVPENLYVNMFIRSFGTPHTIAVVQLVADANGNGRFDDGVDRVFPYSDIPVDWTGWRAFSKSFAELGMTQQQAQQIVAVRVILISNNNTQPTPPRPVDFGIDYITFTAGGPLQL